MAYSGFTIGPKLKKAEISALSELIRNPDGFEWHNAIVQQRRFVGRPVWTRTEEKIIRSEASWCRWIELEEGNGYNFMKLPASKVMPVVVTINPGGRITVWDGIHRIAYSVASNIALVYAKVGLERESV